MLRVFIVLHRVRKGSWSPEDTTISCLTSTFNLFIILSVTTTVFPLILIFPFPVCPFLSLGCLPRCQIRDVGQTKRGQKPPDRHINTVNWVNPHHPPRRAEPQLIFSLCMFICPKKISKFNKYDVCSPVTQDQMFPATVSEQRGEPGC